MPDTGQRIVVSNTSPLFYLHQLGELDILRELYGEIVVTPDVVWELDAGRAEGESVPNVAGMPWVLVKGVEVPAYLSLITDLGRGERSVLAMGAQDPKRALLIMDEKLGRRLAGTNGLTVTGTVGVLLKAKQQGIVQDVKSRLDRLVVAGFYLGDATYRTVLQLAGESA